jgi:uncharacterized protein YlxW (UPF0749 family)
MRSAWIHQREIRRPFQKPNASTPVVNSVSVSGSGTVVTVTEKVAEPSAARSVLVGPPKIEKVPT